ncbi:hypothetical protein QUB80_12535 [Chlorogloeopsis sp. ULAP01]|uniref:hypothetical protein n=1 Tax=Chlorogloeopsis sp. ULAP01 TaxID=3056483 RepID=UPI0025AB15EB|nr:hypothetical protein [Chlorogloeopsis sp. ULAP01]MDM9381528.1 hypothetical protein [Chlorogloeopsis sp. ULAP01]
MHYLVTTNLSHIPKNHQIIMVDGTVPGWQPRFDDLHWDHHRLGGAEIQIDEMPIPKTKLVEDFATTQPTCIVTPQVDADACCAAAWVQMPREVLLRSQVVDRLRAIAWDCDHLMVPEELNHLAEFALKAVAAMKSFGSAIATELQLSPDRQTWTPEDWERYMSISFQRSTEWLMAAAVGDRAWPGEQGEADNYLKELETDAQQLIVQQRIRLIPTSCGLVGICNLKGIGRYIDPRAFYKSLTVIADIQALRSETLVIREHKNGGTQYTLGCLPTHSQTPNLDYTSSTFERLTLAELIKNPHAEGWGGRRTVGGSGWNTPSQLSPEEIVELIG